MLTPTAKSQVLAGIGLWTIFWSILQKVDSLPIVGRRKLRKRIVNWVDRNKALTILCTELVNFGVHGVESPSGVTFAIGGTIVNCIYVLMINPVIRRFL